jgi:hypothetical protein
MSKFQLQSVASSGVEALERMNMISAAIRPEFIYIYLYSIKTRPERDYSQSVQRFQRKPLFSCCPEAATMSGWADSLRNAGLQHGLQAPSGVPAGQRRQMESADCWRSLKSPLKCR